MKASSAIQHVHRNDIHPEKWNAAVLSSRVPLVYAHYDYLECMTDQNWSALIFGDYEAVFPLPQKARFGLTYIVQPPFCQQLGAFGSNQDIATKDFIQAIPSRFCRVRLQLNPYFDDLAIRGVTPKQNFILPLDTEPKYNKDCRKNLASLQQHPIHYEIDQLSFEHVVEIYRDAWGQVNQQLTENQYKQFVFACEKLKRNDAAYTLCAKDPDTNEVYGAAILLGFRQSLKYKEKHLHYVCAGPTPKGRDLGVMHGIIHQAIQQHRGENNVFDFEGSGIPSVASFYQKFGPTEKPYHLFKRGI
jgi:hypothetical protein